jgi:hypothetical protein
MYNKHHAEGTFLQMYLNGKVLDEDIDDYVAQWHSNPGNQELYEFLGLTRDEYSLWLRDPDVLPYIALARRDHKPLTEVIASAVKEIPMAARSSDAVKISRLKHWLAMHGKID